MIVIDASASGPLLLDDEVPPPDRIMAEIVEGPLSAPAHWPLEVTSLLLAAERRKRLSASDRRFALRKAQALGVAVAGDTGRHVWEAAAELALAHGLTIYDAAYLEQALRTGAALASIDGDLCEAAERCGVQVLTWATR